ncbi:MAG: GGDEF domain-containing protein [Clostridiales bacterium]|jgi:diguanylate cyclase (GGDEF)-like protein|nr:GGDEF domain-containing protein [Clostridiales bacterium]
MKSISRRLFLFSFLFFLLASAAVAVAAYLGPPVAAALAAVGAAAVCAAALREIIRRLIFVPIDMLKESLTRLKENKTERIYGIDNDDEIGRLSNSLQDLFSQGHYDMLTGVFNRKFVEETFPRTVSAMSRSKSKISVFMINVDFHKKYLEAYGQNLTDECFKAVAAALTRGMTRADDCVARYSGDEFVAILPDTDETGARVVADKILANIRGMNIEHKKSTVADHVTMSVGIATATAQSDQKWDMYFKRAGEALARSKQNGRNQYTFLELE